MGSNMRRALAMALCVLLAGMGAAACGDDQGPGGPGVDASTSDAQSKENYEQAMDQMRAQLENPQAPPPQMSINKGNRNQLLDLAQRWDAATATVKSITPPDDIKAEHADLVKAMEQLGNWNRRIAAAAPNKARTRKLGKQAKNSAASKAFGEAVRAIEAKGYHVMTAPEDDSLEDAGSPVQ
jgi:hypothetical protein